MKMVHGFQQDLMVNNMNIDGMLLGQQEIQKNYGLQQDVHIQVDMIYIGVAIQVQ